ncbi:MAG TPA: hypothetical protein VF797_22075, partial [Noviherbaspirillum sp.]
MISTTISPSENFETSALPSGMPRCFATPAANSGLAVPVTSKSFRSAAGLCRLRPPVIGNGQQYGDIRSAWPDHASRLLSLPGQGLPYRVRLVRATGVLPGLNQFQPSVGGTGRLPAATQARRFPVAKPDPTRVIPMSQLPSSGKPPERRTHLIATSTLQAVSSDRHQGSQSSLPVVSERASNGANPVLVAAPSSSLDAAVAATIRRLTAVLNDIDPVDTTALQRLRDLCEQLHLSQSAIDAASEGKADVAPVPGFRRAVLAFTERLHAALQGKAPALVLQHLADVEVICLGLCAFASVKAPSPYPAHPDLMKKACRALDGITSRLLAIVDAQRGVDSMGYGQMLNVHNWISRACKARLLTANSASMTAAKSFSAEVLGEFSRRASIWHADARLPLHLSEHDIGKTAAELKTMLDYGLVSFIGQEDSLAQVVAWLSSAPSFALLMAAENGIGLSSLFSLFKSILDLGVRNAEAAAQHGAASHGASVEQDPLALLWKQMIASIGLLEPQKLFNDDGRFLAACTNLLRAMHETGLPRRWSAGQRLAFTNAGRRVLDMVAGADPARLAAIALPTLSNLVSFIKAWHKHELMHELKGANKPAASEHPATEAPHQRTAHYAETRNRLKRAAEQVTSALLPDKLARLDRNDTVGALFKGLFSLRQARLLTPALVDPLLVVLASAVANIPNWPTNHAIDIAKGLNILFSDKVFEWHALQPAFHALMGWPAHGESWSASDVAAFVRGSKVESRQMLSLPLERHVKPASG